MTRRLTYTMLLLLYMASPAHGEEFSRLTVAGHISSVISNPLDGIEVGDPVALTVEYAPSLAFPGYAGAIDPYRPGVFSWGVPGLRVSLTVGEEQIEFDSVFMTLKQESFDNPPSGSAQFRLRAIPEAGSSFPDGENFISFRLSTASNSLYATGFDPELEPLADVTQLDETAVINSSMSLTDSGGLVWPVQPYNFVIHVETFALDDGLIIVDQRSSSFGELKTRFGG